MYFEAAEKKAEIQIASTGFSLINDINDEFWQDMVSQCGASIISSINNQTCKAFLLSESSLFVWHDRLLIITCGETLLVNSIEYVIERLGIDAINQITYQRKNEFYAHAQPTCFNDDVKRLLLNVKGNAYRLGELDDHHNYLFHYHDNFCANVKDKTYELLTYQICQHATEQLTSPNISAIEIRKFLQLDQLLPNFQIDDFVFNPYGYSLNGICQNDYFTIHVTPQAECSYVSLESSIDLTALAPTILKILVPLSFDLLSFNDSEFRTKIKQFDQLGYVSKSLVKQPLSNGYQVNFANFIKPAEQFILAATIEI